MRCVPQLRTRGMGIVLVRLGKMPHATPFAGPETAGLRGDHLDFYATERDEFPVAGRRFYGNIFGRKIASARQQVRKMAREHEGDRHSS